MTPAVRLPVVDAVAPPERLAAFRILVGVFATLYVLTRVRVYLGLGGRPEGAFEGVGVLGPLSGPLPHGLVVAVVLATVATGVASTLGTCFRATAPIFAVGLLVLGTYRSSFGQLLHFENLFVLHAMVLAASPAADAWAVRPLSRARRSPDRTQASTSYGFPLALASMITVLTYVIAGIAKLHNGGVEWVVGDTLRNHVAYSAARLDLIGGAPAPLAAIVVDHAWVLGLLAAATVLIELGAPLALLGRRWRWTWSGLAWSMHVGILATMVIAFPYPLFGVAFAPLFRLEHLRHPLSHRPRWLRRVIARASSRATIGSGPPGPCARGAAPRRVGPIGHATPPRGRRL